ncbi:hypothetical protein [Aliiroseovarius crassostreae]|uniref:hypothetical protein n=1 Tax=Aliiroseovarius crassostreae TaxID=154981 RepID=UPI003C7D29D7
MAVRPLWRELSLTRETLQDRDLSVHGVWTMHIGVDTPPRVYIDWQFAPNKHEIKVAEHIVVARKIIHILPGDAKPWMQ